MDQEIDSNHSLFDINSEVLKDHYVKFSSQKQFNEVKQFVLLVVSQSNWTLERERESEWGKLIWFKHTQTQTHNWYSNWGKKRWVKLNSGQSIFFVYIITSMLLEFKVLGIANQTSSSALPLPYQPKDSDLIDWLHLSCVLKPSASSIAVVTLATRWNEELICLELIFLIVNHWLDEDKSIDLWLELLNQVVDRLDLWFGWFKATDSFWNIRG